jgi:hypothetical protein
MEPDHRLERKAARDAARAKAQEAEEAEPEEEEKQEEPEEKEQATGKDNVEASEKKTEAADASEGQDVSSSVYLGANDRLNQLEREIYTTSKKVSRTCQVCLQYYKNG